MSRTSPIKSSPAKSSPSKYSPSKSARIRISRKAQALFEKRLENAETGIFANCGSCDRVRFLSNVYDPSVLLYEKFTCEDADRTCSDPVEKTVRESRVFYDIAFTPGSIVLVEIGEPGAETWWPGIVEDCPDEKSQFFMLPEKNRRRARVIEPISYYATLFGRGGFGQWCEPEKIQPLRPAELDSLVPRHVLEDQEFQEALITAKNAMELGMRDRLLQCSFIGQKLNKGHRAKKWRAGEDVTDESASASQSQQQLVQPQPSSQMVIDPPEFSSDLAPEVGDLNPASPASSDYYSV